MRFGVATPNCCEVLLYPLGFASHESMVRMTQKAEKLGYDSVWANDHMTTQDYVKQLSPRPPNYFEPLVSLSFIAEATSRIRLGTSVIVLPLRNPVVLAKQVATLDTLSGGRMILGVGAGAYKEEFEALNPSTPTKARATIMDESVHALKKLFTETRSTFNGEYVKFFGVEMYPKPVQKPLPLWMGGNSLNGIRRTAEVGTGWSPAMLSPREIEEGVATLRNYAMKLGRGDFQFEVAPQYTVCIAKTQDEAVEKFKDSLAYKHLVSLQRSTLRAQSIESFIDRNLIGTPDRIADKIEKLEEAGATYLPDLVIPANSLEEMLDSIKMFADEVMPRFL